MFCSKCGAQVSPKGRFCSACGEVVDPDAGATLLGDEASLEGATIAPPAPAPRKTPASPSSPRTPRPLAGSNPLTSSDPIGGGRFTPGQIIAERYRVVALAGRGFTLKCAPVGKSPIPTSAACLTLVKLKELYS